MLCSMFQWLTTSAIKGELLLEDSYVYHDYTLTDLHTNCPSYIRHVVLLSMYLVKTKQGKLRRQYLYADLEFQLT